MRQLLHVHPDFPSAAVSGIEVDVVRRPGRVELQYRVTGKTDALRLPPFVTSARTDELWKHTCFEAFIRPASADAYFEFNFAPSTQWAAYGFTRTREGMHNADATPDRIKAEKGAALYTLDGVLDLTRIPALLEATPWHLNLTAVTEETDGRKSYWALAHPTGKPDFHNPDCFVLELPAA
jgi:hypothetical protein